ncbi:LuxR C-terminal-related transcriptional regulator [Kibdelosporangium philippinense]|uniref:LuxR C-terminal-related transcriptional regulator n=1 Tax=Kibdelosporangium philippinense TaxID=211113 RepID=A0ABS8ZDJ1_9PSEU|nr:LuxR C-terminal-related transcriptional regulator [Kibdelosporangium philippinense]MCE7004930.1 LuxR C-terminal-related transcriptional regulator [Kibdelosporangium philippinense]
MRSYVTAGQPWLGMARVAGAYHPVLACASDYVPSGALLVLIRPDSGPLDADAIMLAQQLWDLAVSYHYRAVQNTEAAVLTRSRAVVREREAAVGEMSEARSSVLTGLLGVLRSKYIDDAAARSTATEVVLNALQELRTDATSRRIGGDEEPFGQAFQRLADSLRPLLKHSQVKLELDPPKDDVLLRFDVANSARVAVRAVVLAVLGQDDVSRVRVRWRVSENKLVATVRDDGPGVLDEDIDIGDIAGRVRAQGGTVEVDPVPGWGLTAKVTMPLAASSAGPLTGLSTREQDVLEHLAMGQRNRAIARALAISESTVKFHVANILTKLSVGSRTEAAAVFHASAG